MAKQEVWSAKQFQQHYQKTEGAKLKAPRLRYGNIKTEVDGIKFDSKKEAEYYGQLKIRKKAGQIKDFRLQPVYKIVINGKLVCKYVADFEIVHPDGNVRVIDVKSEATKKDRVFRLKSKLMEAALGIIIEIV